MAVKDGTSGGKDAAYRQSARTWNKRNDQYAGRTSDEDLAASDGKCLGERDEWAMEKVNRRGQWQDTE